MDEGQSEYQSENAKEKSDNRFSKFKKSIQEWLAHFSGNFKSEIRTVKFWVELAALIGLGIYTFFAGWQVCETRNAIKVTREAIETQTRPSLSIEVLPETIKVHPSAPNPNSPTIYADFDIKIRNYGQSAAVFGRPKFVLTEDISVQQKDMNRYDICGRADSEINALHNRELDSAFLGIDGSIVRHVYAEAEPSRASPPSTPQSRVAGMLLGCISYRRQETIYHTEIAYHVEYSAELKTGNGTTFREIVNIKRWYVEPY